MNSRLSHIDHKGRACMVNVSSKEIMRRTAIASGFFVAKAETIDALMTGDLPKGAALSVARIAGIQAAKQCANLIPLCHPLPIECVSVDFERIAPDRLKILATVVVTGKTGIEMEALTAVSIAALTLIDMTKAIDKDIRIDEIALVEKKKEAV